MLASWPWARGYVLACNGKGNIPPNTNISILSINKRGSTQTVTMTRKDIAHTGPTPTSTPHLSPRVWSFSGLLQAAPALALDVISLSTLFLIPIINSEMGKYWQVSG
jgi:hypothetical protein